MNLNTLTELLPSLAASGLNIGLLGQPGVGKTEFVREWAKTLKASDIRPDLAEPGDDEKPVRFISVATTTKESVDVSGLMLIENGVTKWAPPEWVPRDNEAAIVFLDEFPQSELPTQLAFQKLIDRDLDGANVSKRALFIVAGNRAADNAGVNEMPSHIRNRFAWFDIETDVDAWRQWASSNGVLKIVIDFILLRPKMLNTFNPKCKDNAYATPRSITRLSDVLKRIKNQMHWMTLAAAICGPAWAAEFEQFRKLQSDLPSVDDVLKSPDTFSMPSDFGVLNALGGAIVEAAAADRSKIDAAMTIIGRMYHTGKSEIASKCLRDIANRCPAVTAMSKYDPLFNRLGNTLAS